MNFKEALGELDAEEHAAHARALALDLDVVEARHLAAAKLIRPILRPEFSASLADILALCAELRATRAEREDARAWVRRLTAIERVLTCVYCGEAYPPGSPTHGAEVLTAHVRMCPKHPMREAEAIIAAWERMFRAERACGHAAAAGMHDVPTAERAEREAAALSLRALGVNPDDAPGAP